jgi:hypothetical protein
VSTAVDDIIARLATAGDTAEGLEQLYFGSTGGWIVYPAPPEEQIIEGKTGQAWVDMEGDDTLRKWEMENGLGAFLDDRSIVRAKISTNATGVGPSFVEQLGCTSATKDEGNDRITLSFAIDFETAHYVVTGGSDGGLGGVPRIVNPVTQAVGSVIFEVYDLDSVRADINDLNVQVLIIGFQP